MGRLVGRRFKKVILRSIGTFRAACDNSNATRKSRFLNCSPEVLLPGLHYPDDISCRVGKPGNIGPFPISVNNSFLVSLEIAHIVLLKFYPAAYKLINRFFEVINREIEHRESSGYMVWLRIDHHLLATGYFYFQ